MHSLTIHHSDNVAWYRQVAAGWARRLITGDSPEAWAQNTDIEIQFALKQLHLRPGDHLLDLGCGWGRHSLALAAYGLRVTGVDISSDLLTLARYNAQRRNLRIEWVEANIAEMTLSDSFDAVVQFCGNFLTWFESRDRTRNALWNVSSLLRPGGRLLIGTDTWRPELPQRTQDWDEWDGGAVIYRHYYDEQQRIARSQTVVFGPQHQRREYHRQRWWPSRGDMETLFDEVGLQVVNCFNGCDAAPYDPRRPGLVYVAERKPER